MIARLSHKVFDAESRDSVERSLSMMRRLALALLLGSALLCTSTSIAAADNQQECSNESLRSALGLTLLPDCRAYEMATPPYKEGYPILVRNVAANGESAIVLSLATLADSQGSSERLEVGSIYLDRRTNEGWRLSPLNAPMPQFVGQYMVAAEADRGETLWLQHTLAQSATSRGLYARSSTGLFSFIGPDSLPNAAEGEPSDTSGLATGEFAPVKAATYDYGHVLLEAVEPQERWPFDETSGTAHSLYEYSGTDNKEPTLVGVEGGRGSRKLIALCGTTMGAGRLGSSYNALSSDGETIFFTVNACSPGPATTEVYARLHGGVGDVGSAETIDVSASECTVACGEAKSGKNFEGASEDGKLVYFTSTQKLTNNAIDGTAGGDATGKGCAKIGIPTPPEVGGCNLYVYNFTKPVGERLKAVSIGGEVLGVAGIAEDGLRVYYVSRAEIGSSGENVYASRPMEGQPNLYVYDAVSGKTSFVATLAENDHEDWSKRFERPVQLAGSNGRYLLFADSAPNVTPDDSSSVTQLFEYRAPGEGEGGEPGEAAELVRVTKGEEGFNEDGNGVSVGPALELILENASRLGDGVDFKSTTNRLNISVDGRRVFFSTTGQLSARATSAAHGCESLYEFGTPGALSKGSVHLVSDGSDTTLYRGAVCGILFQGMDASGSNVLFSTGDPLLMGDVDGGQLDNYDARVGGGFTPPPSSEACNLGSCEGATSSPPMLPVVGSANAGGETSVVVTSDKKDTVHGKKRAGSRLAHALEACRGKPRRRRATCERSVRRRLAVAARVSGRKKGDR